jgi:hypothetical protein
MQYLDSLTTTETFDVSTQANLVTLTTAKTGDIAFVPDAETEGKYVTYMLAGDYSALANWRPFGVSYVAEAGHALNADTAVNSQKINGHRLVTYDSTGYASAVKDADTLYAVYEGA